MPRQKSDKRKQAYEMWKSSCGTVKLKNIATALGVSDTQIRKWKSQDNWDEIEKVTLSMAKGNVTNKRGSLKPDKKTKKEINCEEPELTEKQVLFVAEYLRDYNATRAAMAVGYSKKTASQIGYQLLQKTSVQVEIKRQMDLVTMNLGITSQRVLLEYLKIAFADLSDYIEFGQKEILVGVSRGGEPIKRKINTVDLIDKDQVDGTVIQEIRQGKSGVSIKLHDKMKALEKLEKYLDLLPDVHKRRIEEEKLRLERERLEHAKEIDKMKVF